MVFYWMKVHPRPPVLKIERTQLEIVPVTCLLGVWLQANLKWSVQVDKMLSKANGRLFMLRKVKRFNLPTDDLVQVYTSYVRPVVEYCAPVWHPGLTSSQTVRLERVQKRALRTILGEHYIDYETALLTTNLQTLEKRRIDLCLKFAKKLDPSLLPPRAGEIHGRSTRNSDLFKTVRCRTNRYRNSPLPFLVRLLNKHS